MFGLNDRNTTFWIIAKWDQFPRASHVVESLSSRFSTGSKLIFFCQIHFFLSISRVPGVSCCADAAHDWPYFAASGIQEPAGSCG